jgi:hypothetical protein
MGRTGPKEQVGWATRVRKEKWLAGPLPERNGETAQGHIINSKPFTIFKSFYNFINYFEFKSNLNFA